MKRLLWISLFLNVALLVLAARHRPQKPEAPIPAAARPEIHPAETAAAPSANSVASAPEGTSPWAQVESADPAQFMANLRAIGCPEETGREVFILRVCR